MAYTIDELLEMIGGFGRYQIILVFVFGYVAMTLDCIPVMIVAFITTEPGWICVTGNNSVCNFTEPISLTSEHYKARCSMPRDNWTFVNDYTSTVTEYDLVCEKSYLQSVAQSCFWVGGVFGYLISGYLSDRFGRKPILYSGIVGMVLTTWITVFPVEFGVFIAGRLCNGIFSGFIATNYYVILVEYISTKHRAALTGTFFVFWCIALLLLALLAYLIRDWRHLLLTTLALATPGILLWWITPESARWLFVHGKTDEARQKLSKVAKINKKTFPGDDIKIPESSESCGNLKHLFQDWNISKRTLACWNISFTVNLVYYGVSYGSVDLGWDPYLTFALSSLVELPSAIASIPSANRLGRRKSIIMGLSVSCVAAIIAISFPSDEPNKGYIAGRILAMAITARFFINLAFCCLYIWTVELFPTFVRSMGLSTSIAIGKIGSFVASYVIWLIRIHPLLPYGIMGVLCLQSSLVALLLPETSRKETLETMDDMKASHFELKDKTDNSEKDVKPIHLIVVNEQVALNAN